ncbi:cytosine permease [Jeotgalibacillus sp. R-1-5s-1]|uniref:cytosine permease n=1 Tax=Jeotgalibacillus sp. R-1-5s-1 TaxID=2555897 RepID=UPI00106A43C1|nr:cytosine permease [Jeotgalibacillus sp. R-1-5s-1]TFD92509.1 cytosine permease [Jeotgalibacillus sp. R-1-5s-1]
MQKTNAVRKIQIEKIGLDEVPSSLKQTRWYEYAFIQIAFSVNTGNVLVPALAVLTGGLSAGWAMASTMSGALLAFLLVSLLSLPGARHGLPAQYVIRTMIGTRLSRYFASPVRSITSLYWFSVQTIGGSMVIQFILREYFNISVPLLLLTSLFSIMMTVLALIGFDAVKKTIKWFIPVLFLSQGLMIYLIIRYMTSADAINMNTGEFSSGMFLFFAGLAFVQYVSGVSASSDITRYAKSPGEGFTGVFIGNAVGFTVVALIGTLYAASLGSVNPFVTASELTDSTLLILLIAAGAVISMISINLSNAYTGGYSLLNAFPRIGRVNSAMLFGIAATLLSLFPVIVEQAEFYISLLGAAIIPLSAIIVTDYLFFKRLAIQEDDLLKLMTGTSLANTPALLTVIICIPLYLLIPDQASPGFTVFLAASLLYAGLKSRKT